MLFQQIIHMSYLNLVFLANYPWKIDTDFLRFYLLLPFQILLLIINILILLYNQIHFPLIKIQYIPYSLNSRMQIQQFTVLYLIIIIIIIFSLIFLQPQNQKFQNFPQQNRIITLILLVILPQKLQKSMLTPSLKQLFIPLLLHNLLRLQKTSVIKLILYSHTKTQIKQVAPLQH